MRRRVVDTNGFGLIRLRSRSGVRAEFPPTGALFALRHDATLINQLLPGPAEDGLFRLPVRCRADGAAGVGRGPWPIAHHGGRRADTATGA